MKSYTAFLVKTLFLLLSGILIFSNAFSQISGPGSEDREFDYSGFEVLTPEAFVDKNFDLLKQLYEKDPAIIDEGYKIEIVPAPNPKYRPTVKTNQVYHELVHNTVLQWARDNGFKVYNLGGMLVKKDAENFLEISYNETPFGPPHNKTPEEYFKKSNPSVYTNAQSDYMLINSRYSTFNGLLDYEKEVTNITQKKNVDGFLNEVKTININGGTVSKEKSIELLKSYADYYIGSVTLIDSKYGGFSASTEKSIKSKGIKGSLAPVFTAFSGIFAACDAKINKAKSIFLVKMGVDTVAADTTGEQIVAEFSAKGYLPQTRVLKNQAVKDSVIALMGMVTDEDGNPVNRARVTVKSFNIETFTDSTGLYALSTKISDNIKPEVIDVKLKKANIEIYCEDLGTSVTDTFGIISDGFTTLKFKVKVNGIEPQSVLVKRPALGSFVEHTMLNLPLVLNNDGTGEMEYIPPEYLTNSQLTKQIEIDVNEHNQYGLSGKLWVAEVPVTITFDDENGNQGSYTFTIFVSRPPVFLIHGFTGDETTWANFAKYLANNKYEAVIREYYRGPIEESTIERQAEKLGFYIQKLRDNYLKNHFVQRRIDIVAHSMGGLISRYYIQNMNKYGAKAGVYIPYDVKLSRDEIKAARYKKPVVLNDVRKLIMVGTPNHGSSWLDEKLGALAALASDYHQLANAQLRKDSRFLAGLNKGENEGRHLDKNVQYAIICGNRHRSTEFPPDVLLHPIDTENRELTSDDGVVPASSARLNGVISYSFPVKKPETEGYIHSPAIKKFFPKDASITEADKIFKKINELLLENISRVPLNNSVAKIIRADGDVKYRDYSTSPWNTLTTPVYAAAPVKLNLGWCHFETGEGSADVGFILNGHHWGTFHFMPNTNAYYEYVTPEYVRIYIEKGRARFQSRKTTGGGFEIVLGKEGAKWYMFNPKAKVVDLNTDFTVEESDGNIIVQSISGKIAVDNLKSSDKKSISVSVGGNEGVKINDNGSEENFEVGETGWWSVIDTTFLPDDTLGIIQDSSRYMLTVGKITVNSSEKYLPLSGFTNLSVHIDSVPNAQLNVRIVLKEAKKFPVISILNQEGILDTLGNFKTNITIVEPDENTYETLKDIPLSATFSVQVVYTPANRVLKETDFTLPLGMALFHGKTTGPDYKPRTQPFAPELYPNTFQILNEKDDEGNFYILFNTALYDKEILKEKKFAGRTHRKFDAGKFNLYLKWDNSATIPMEYMLPDSVRENIKPGSKFELGHNGYFDILSPEEHEKKLIGYLESFVEKMPLKADEKADVFNKLKQLGFVYQSSFDSVWAATLENSDSGGMQISVPVDKINFWGNVNPNAENPVYTLIMHVFGHFLQQTVGLPAARHFGFLAGNCSAGKNLWIPRNINKETLFDEPEYISFNEAEADFFAYLMTQYIGSADSEFVNKSLFYNPGYLRNLRNVNRVLKSENQYPAYLLSGNQSYFLINYYDTLCNINPVAVFSDFMFAKLQYGEYSGTGHSASTINEWLKVKHIIFNTSGFVTAADPYPKAEEAGLLNRNAKYELIPLPAFDKAVTTISGKQIAGFEEIPACLLSPGTKVKIGSGFILVTPCVDTIKSVWLKPGAEFEIDENNKLILLADTFVFNAPLKFETLLAKFNPSGNKYEITVGEKKTNALVINGSLSVVSEKDDEVVVPAGFHVYVTKNGKIRKPKAVKKYSLPKAEPLKMPFIKPGEDILPETNN